MESDSVSIFAAECLWLGGLAALRSTAQDATSACALSVCLRKWYPTKPKTIAIVICTEYMEGPSEDLLV